MPGDIAISGVRILLIDDDPEFCSLLNDYLELNSISLTCAHDGQSGLDILDRRAFDLILLDMFLPDINGLDVLRRIRRMQSPPVVMLSAHNEETDRIIALEIGADDYVPRRFPLGNCWRASGPCCGAVLRSRKARRRKKRTAGISSACATSP